MLPDFVQQDADLTPFNTLALPARALFFARVTSVADLLALGSCPELCGCSRFILGGGSNLVLTGDFPGLIIHMEIMGRVLSGEDNGAWYVSAGAGENWHEFVQWTLTQGWPGLENLSLIPGTVGAAPIQNIGAYGLEVGEYIWSLETIDLDTGETKRFDTVGCRFGYRDSLFKRQGWSREGRYAITRVTFRLPKHWEPRMNYAEVATELERRGWIQPSPHQVAEVIAAIRQRKLPDPSRIPNTGSFFQNPVVAEELALRLSQQHPNLPCYLMENGQVKLAAGWLIEQAGWKGHGLGPVSMYENQALVLVNRGGATSEDVLKLTRAVQAAVQERFGVTLVPEPVFL
ncbi:MAG: UDP-N-acetylmuramate dehydrogenase [Azovibrio sp.]